MFELFQDGGLLSFGPEGWGDELLIGAWVTLQLAVVSFACGLFLGFGLAAARLSKYRAVQWPAAGYLLFMRGVPEFLVLLLVYNLAEQGLNQALMGLGFEGRVEIPRFAAAVLGLSLIFAAYFSEVLRGAYLAVPEGQMEAARAIGMSPFAAFWRVRLPQMWRFAIPGLGNLWMVVLKDTSLAAVIALDEVMRVAKVAGESEAAGGAAHAPLVFFLAAGVLYLMMTAVSDAARARLEARSRRGLS